MATIQGKTTARVMAKQGLTVEASEALARSRADALQKRSEASRKSTERLSQINTALQDAISKGDINQIDILNADFKSAQEDAKKNATDLAQAMVGLGEGFKDIGLALAEIQDLAPNEQQVIDDAKEFAASKKAKLEAARIKRAQAEGKTNILGIRAKAIAAADIEIETAKAESETAETAVKTAEQGAESMRRSRLESMSFEQSLQRMQTVTQRIIEMAKDRIGEIEGNLEAVEVGRHEIVEDLKRYSVEVDEGDKALKQGKAELQGLLAQQTELFDKNSAEWTDLLGQIKEKQNELGTIESARNIAYSRSQNGQRFLEGLGMQEETQRTLLSFHKIWIANLEDSVRHRSTMTDSHLGVIRAVGD